MPTERITLEDFLRDIALDCWGGILYEAALNGNRFSLGSSADGSRLYRIEFSYHGTTGSEHVVRNFQDILSLDPGEKPDDYLAYAREKLHGWGIRSFPENGKLAIDVWNLRKPSFSSNDTAQALNVSEQAVIDSYRRLHGNYPKGACMNGRDVLNIAKTLRLGDNEMLERVKKFYAA